MALAKTFLAERFKNNESIILLAIGPDHAVLGFVQLFPGFSSGAAARILILNEVEESGIVHELAAEQGRWTDINERMEELERALTRK